MPAAPIVDAAATSALAKAAVTQSWVIRVGGVIAKLL